MSLLGYYWCGEYGDPDLDDEFQWIRSISPLHNIPSAPDSYPSVLVTTADHDDRVVPAHSFKYIAQLQHQLAATMNRLARPLIIRVDVRAGHGRRRTTPVTRHDHDGKTIVRRRRQAHRQTDRRTRRRLLVHFACTWRPLARVTFRDRLSLSCVLLVLTDSIQLPSRTGRRVAFAHVESREHDVRSFVRCLFEICSLTVCRRCLRTA
jgi:hypothetical protein